MQAKYLNVIPLIVIVIVKPVLSTVVTWGEECEFTDQCDDHRLVCEKVEMENKTKICVCDRYHRWNHTVQVCVPKYTATDILKMIQIKYNISSLIEYEANVVFIAQVGAGLLVMAVGLVCTLTVTIYCYHMWKQDEKLEKIVKDLEAQKNQPKPGPSQGVT